MSDRANAQRLLVGLSRLKPDEPTIQLVADAAHDRADVDWGLVLDQGYRHGVLPMVARNLLSDEVWPHEVAAVPHRRLLLHHYAANRQRNDVYFRELEAILRSCQQADVRVAVRKGPALIAMVYRDRGCRAMSDLDLFVEEAALASVQEIVASHGYRAGSASADRRNVVALERRTAVSWRLQSNVGVPLRKPSTDPFVEMMIVDCCVNLFLPTSAYSVTAAQLCDRIRNVDLGEFDAWCLDTEAFLLDMCAHLFKEATTFVYINLGKDLQLRKFADIAEFIATQEVDWSSFFDLVERFEITEPIGFALHMTEDIYPGSVPDHVLSRLAVDHEFLRTFGRADRDEQTWEQPLRDRLFDASRRRSAPQTRAPRV